MTPASSLVAYNGQLDSKTIARGLARLYQQILTWQDGDAEQPGEKNEQPSHEGKAAQLGLGKGHGISLTQDAGAVKGFNEREDQ